MAKQGMKRPDEPGKKNIVPPVPGISGKAKHGHHPAPTLIPGGEGKVFHPGNDPAEENVLNDWDMTGADIQDFWRKW